MRKVKKLLKEWKASKKEDPREAITKHKEFSIKDLQGIKNLFLKIQIQVLGTCSKQPDLKETKFEI